LLDVGCGAGNYSLKLLERISATEVTLVDLSRPMLERAQQRIGRGTTAEIRAIQGDIREITLEADHYDVIVAAAVLHHLRTDDEWRSVFAKLHACLRPGGTLWIADLIDHTLAPIQEMMWQRYGDYLASLDGPDYRDRVLAYVEREDTPQSLGFQLDMLREVGFRAVEVLHKNSVFAAFGAIK
jgi:tRNA (cmo5U34)-methyltransferase